MASIGVSRSSCRLSSAWRIVSRTIRRAAKSDTCSASDETALFTAGEATRSEEHTSELQSLMRISYAVFCLKKKRHNKSDKTEMTTTKSERTQPTSTQST